MSEGAKRGILGALPFWLAMGVVPLLVWVSTTGGWTLLAVPVYALLVMSFLDAVNSVPAGDLDPNHTDGIFWHRVLTWVWAPVQLVMIFGAIWWVTRSDQLSDREAVYLMIGIGVVSGMIGIVFAHELMHQKSRYERFAGKLLMISVLYGHFVTEHLAVHHTHVATPKDAATARYNESFFRFFPRVLIGSFRSAWRVEAERQRRKAQPVWARQNPFWQYLGGGLGFVLLAYAIGGSWGVGLYLIQSLTAVLELEQINYIEHYGLTRSRKPNGKYEPVHPRHSWNASHRFSNYLLINLQRHSDHHYKPDRRYPLLQSYSETDAPQLPFGYPLMVLLTLNPYLWRRIMNPRVRRWRSMYYPQRLDWADAR